MTDDINLQTDATGAETFIRILQIWQSVGAEYSRAKRPEPNNFLPSPSGEIELELDDNFPALLRTTEGQYSFGGWTIRGGSSAKPRMFMERLKSEFDIVTTQEAPSQITR
jgi:hypothetical protein